MASHQTGIGCWAQNSEQEREREKPGVGPHNPGKTRSRSWDISRAREPETSQDHLEKMARKTDGLWGKEIGSAPQHAVLSPLCGTFVTSRCHSLV